MRVSIVLLVVLALGVALTIFLWVPGSSRPGRWQLVTEGGAVSDEEPIITLKFSDSSRGWALTPSQLMELSDGGKQWTPRLTSEGANKSFSSVIFTTSALGFIVGSQRKGDGYTALILSTIDGGKNWQETPLDVAPVQDIRIPHALHSISFCSPTEGWAIGSDLIIHTVDGGKSWEVQRTGNKEEGLFDVACKTPERAWVVGADGLILETKNAGKTWTRQYSGTKLNLVRLRFFGDDGWIAGGMVGRGILLRTGNGGVSWQSQELNASEPLFDIYLSGKQGWVVGAAGTILETNDGGQTWAGQQSPTTNDLTCLFFLTPREGWAGGAKRTLLRLSD